MSEIEFWQCNVCNRMILGNESHTCLYGQTRPAPNDLQRVTDPKLKECELLPCPWCGGSPEITEQKSGPVFNITEYTVRCRNKCGDFYGYEKAHMIKHWNRRQSSQAILERVLEEVSERLDVYKGSPDYEHGITDAELVFKQIIERIQRDS